MDIQLYTEDSKFVTELTIMPFTRLPRVVIWGERAFVHEANTRYKECFCYCIPPEDPKGKKKN